MTANTQHRLKLTASASVTPAGQFEILAISAGEGNGWLFSEDTLRASLSLWDGVETFVDHGSWWSNRSVRDLGGVCHSPAWDPERAGVKLQLRTLGPSGPLIDALGRELLGVTPPNGADQSREGVQHPTSNLQHPKVGFSADVLFTAKGQAVENILRVLSLDLVFDPARGGEFLRALNQAGIRREAHMSTNVTPPATGQATSQAGTAPTSPTITVNQDLDAVRTLLDVQHEQQALAEEAQAARAVRAAMCAYLLDSGLAASRLPPAMQDHVRAQFTGRVFEPAELTTALDAARSLVSALTASAVVVGPGRVGAMFDSGDKLQAAVDDLLGAPRDKGAEKLKVQRLQGIRELYLMLTGDHDLHGGFYPERVLLATTADFTGLVKNALNKIVTNRWAELGRAGYSWWETVSVVEHFNNLNSITGTLVGTVGDLPTVAEGAEYTELVVGDSPETATFTKYGGYIPLTLELIDRDETRKLSAYPNELASAGLRKISKLVAAIFTDNAGVGPTLADGGALFNSTAVTTAGGHANLLTVALTATQWDVVQAAVYNQPMLIKNAAGFYGTGPKIGINPRYLLVPRALQLSAMKIIYPTLENAANIYSENQQRGQPGDVVTVPEWTDANDFAAVCDPVIAPGIYVGERFGIMPEIFIAGDSLSPAVFMNDEHRLKVRHFLAVWVNDFRPLHKSNVA